MEDLTGKQLGPYQIVAPLGEGGMAAVYKAYQPGVDRYVALKILPRHFASDPHFVARFEQEAKVLAKLQHPHILPVFDFGQVDGYTYIVMPFLQSGDLTDLLKRRPLPLAQFGQIISQVGDALDYAHSRGLVHRDVKPSNVLLDDRGNCLLTDFGIAKIVEGNSKLTATGGILGTPAYMSPEQGMAQKLDGRSDIYSLGIMLYELATGRVPYQAETPMAVMIKHLNDPLPLPRQVNPSLPEPIERVILRALAKQPEDRYATAGEMVQALQAAIAEGESTQTLPDGVSSVTSVTKSTSTVQNQEAISTWKWILVAAVLALVLFIGGIVFFVARGERKAETDAVAIQSVEATIESTPVTVTAANTKQAEVSNEASPTVAPITEVQTPAANTPADPAIYDDFNDRTYDGKINSSLWIEDSPELCNWYQEKGELVLRNTPPQEGIICLLIIGRPALVKVDGLKTEARIQILDSHNKKGADLGISFRTQDTRGEEWEAFCGLTAGPGGVDAVFDATHEQQIRRPAVYNLWYTLRFEVDPDTMTFNCFVNDKLLHSVVPANGAELKNAQFRRGLRGFRDTGAFAITNADDIRIISPGNATASEQSPPTILYEENFEDGKANGWLSVNDGNWSVFQNNGNPVYGVRDQPADLIPIAFLENSSSWQDYSVETEVMFESGELEQIYVTGRTGKGVDCTGYRFGGNRYGISIFRLDPRATCQGETLAEVSNYPLVPNRLYKLKLEFEGTQIRAYIDNELVMTVEDSVYPRGGIALSAYQVKWAYFDNIRVTALEGLAGNNLIQPSTPPTSISAYQTPDPGVTPTSTPTPASAVPSIASGTVLFEEDFEDNKVQGIGFSAEPGWKFAADETGNKVYEIDNRNGPNYKGFSFGMPEWKDYSVEYRARFLESTGKQSEIGSQYRSDGNSYYVLVLGTEEFYLAYSIKGSEWTRLITQFPQIERNIWYNIKADVQGEQISVYLDDTLLVNAKSSEIKQGWPMIFVGPDTHAQIDDIRVVALGE